MPSGRCALVFLGCLLQLSLLPELNAAPDWISQDIKDMVKQDKERCMAKYGTTEDLIDQVNGGNFEDNPVITCYSFCLFEAFSLVDEDANFDVDMILGFLTEELAANAPEILDNCIKEQQTGTDPCNKIYKFGSCVQKKNPKLWFLL